MVIDIRSELKSKPGKIKWKETVEKFQEDHFYISLVIFALVFGTIVTLLIGLILAFFKWLYGASQVWFYCAIALIAIILIMFLLYKVKGSIVREQ